MEEIFHYIFISVCSFLSLGTLVAITRHCHGFLNILNKFCDCFCNTHHIPSHLDNIPAVSFSRKQGEGVSIDIPSSAITKGISVIGDQLGQPAVKKVTGSALPSTAVSDV